MLSGHLRMVLKDNLLTTNIYALNWSTCWFAPLVIRSMNSVNHSHSYRYYIVIDHPAWWIQGFSWRKNNNCGSRLNSIPEARHSLRNILLEKCGYLRVGRGEVLCTQEPLAMASSGCPSPQLVWMLHSFLFFKAISQSSVTSRNLGQTPEEYI